MSDVYLLTAPVLLLGIVALLRFVGCQFTLPAPPVAPTKLSATPGNSEVTLSWTENEKYTEGYSYQINRSNDGLPATVVGTVTYVGTPGPNSSTLYSYLDTSGLSNGITYTYTVTLFVYGVNYGTTNAVAVTPTLFTNRPPGSVVDQNSPLYAGLIGLFLMNEGTLEAMQGIQALDQNIAYPTNPGAWATPDGNAVPTWEVADPSILFNGGPSLNSYLNYLNYPYPGVDARFNDMTANQITVVASVQVSALAQGGICEKNDGKGPQTDSGFIFAMDNNGALRVTVELSTQSVRLTTVPVVVVGQWMQLAFTWDNTQYIGATVPSKAIVIYVNQQVATTDAARSEDGQGTLNTKPLANAEPFRIGNASYDFPGSFNGKIAYMAVYKGRLLTSAYLATLDTQLPITAG